LLIDSDWLWAGGRLSGGDPDVILQDGREWAFKPEHGVHAIWGGYVNMKALIDRFTDTRLIPSVGEEWINRWGRDVARIEAGNAVRARFIPAPFHYLNLLFHPAIWSNITPLDFLSLPGVLASIMLTVGVDPIREKRAWDGLMMNEYFRGWTPNLKATFRGLGANLLAAHEDDISLASFIAALRFYTMMRRDAWNMSYLPNDSHTSLIQPLLDSIQTNGGHIMGGITAKRLERIDGGWQITVEDAMRQGYRTISAPHIILATNAPSAKRLLVNSPATTYEAQQMPIPSGLRNIVIRLWFDESPREGTAGGMFTGDFVPDNFFWLHRLYDDFDEWHRETGGSAIEVHLYGADDLLDQSDANLIILCVKEIQTAFPELRNHFIHGTVRRNSKVHTQWRVPTEDSLHVKTPWEGIYACGDWVGYDTPSLWMERATVTGLASANAVIEANQLEPYEVLYPPKPEIPARVLSGIAHGGRFALAPLFQLMRMIR